MLPIVCSLGNGFLFQNVSVMLRLLKNGSQSHFKVHMVSVMIALITIA